MLEDMIETIRAAQRRKLVEEEIINKNIKAMNDEFEAYAIGKWNAKFSGVPVKIYASFQGGCMVLEWEPSGFISKVADLTLMKDGSWRKYAYTPESEEVCPIHKSLIDDFCKDIEKESGIKFRLFDHEMPRLCDEEDYDKEDDA